MAGKSANSRYSSTARAGAKYGPSTTGLFGSGNVTGKQKEYHTFTNADARVASALIATGGNVADAYIAPNGWTYHTFTSPGTFTVTSGFGDIQVLMVGGGGSGGYRIAGGGGAGGVLHGTVTNIVNGDVFTVEVGKGGAYGDALSTGGEPSNFYASGTSFPNPTNYARAYGGGCGTGYGIEVQTPINPGTTMTAPTPGSIGGGCAGGSGGGAGGQYGTGGFPGLTSKLQTNPGAPSDHITGPASRSPITPNTYRPAHTPEGSRYAAMSGGYGSDAPNSPGPTTGYHPTDYNQSSFPTTYYMGLQGYGNPGGMTYGPTLNGGGAGGGGAGGVGSDVGTAPNTSAPSTIAGADAGTGMQFDGFTAPMFCDPSTPTGPTVKSTLDPLGGYFAGGGGGSNYTATQGGNYGGGRGGDGGGGNGAPNGPSTSSFPPTTFRTPTNGYSSTNQDGVFYSGGGGGGDGYSLGTGGHGGPGIVIIRYQGF